MPATPLANRVVSPPALSCRIPVLPKGRTPLGVRRRTRVFLSLGNPSAGVEPQVGTSDQETDSLEVTSERSSFTPVVDDENLALEEEQRNRRLWKAAIKLPMYWVALIPVMVGGSLAYFEYGKASLFQIASLAAAAVLIIGWLNLSNDAFDAATGVDETKPESVVNLTGNRGLVLIASMAAFIAGAGLLVTSLGSSNFPTSLALLAFSIVCGYVYQGPPFRWSYKGLGEPLCFFAFGPSATTAFFLALAPTAVQLGQVPPSVWISSTLVGITTTLVLFCSHFHQHDGDKAAGKLSPIVRLGGTAPAVKILQWCAKLPFVVLLMATFAQEMPWLAVVCCGGFALPKANDLVSFAVKNHRDLGTIARLKVVALGLHSSFGLALCFGLVLAKATGF